MRLVPAAGATVATSCTVTMRKIPSAATDKLRSAGPPGADCQGVGDAGPVRFFEAFEG